jgi:hypothetical protein
LFFPFLLLLLYLWTLFFLEDFQFNRLKSVHYRDIYFNSFSADPQQFSIKEYTEKDQGLHRKIQIQFRMKVSAIENHPNVFQTGPGNSGIRMELGPPAYLGLVIGAKRAEGFRGFILTKNLQFNQWVQVKFSLNPAQRLTVFLDGTKVLEIADKDFAYEISQIAIGTGFNKTRSFKGELIDFGMQYEFLERTWVTENMVTAIQILLLALGVILTLIVTFRNRNYLVPALFLILALYLLCRCYPEKMHLTTVKTIQHRGLSYNSQAMDRAQAAPRFFPERVLAVQKEVEAQFRLKVFDTDGYPNVFQTGPKNFGIRLEIGPPSNLGVVVGAKNPQGMSEFLLSRDLQLHRWYSVKLSIDRDQRLVAFLDEKKIVDVIDATLDYEISEVAVGTGFSQTRPFKGELADFNLEYRFWKRVAAVPYVEVGLLAIFFFLAVKTISNLINFVAVRQREDGFSREEKIHLIGFMIIAGFTAEVMYHYILAQYLELGFPYNTFLASSQVKFTDFFNVYYQMKGINPGWNFLIAPPVGYLVLYPFTFFNPQWAFTLFLSLFFLPFAYWNARNLASPDRITHLQNVFVFSFLPYPVLFALDRGNVETLSFLFVFLFISFYRKQRWVWSILFLSLGIYLKMTPAVFLVLFLGEKRFKEILITLALTLLLYVTGILWFPGSFGDNLHALVNNLKMYQEIYVIGPEGWAFGHSLFGLLKVIYQHLAPSDFENLLNIQRLSTIYFWGAMIIFVLVALYFVWGKEELWKKITLLVFAMNLLPHVSGDYKLLYVFIPLYLFLGQKGSIEDDMAFCLIFGLLLIPKTYYPMNPSGLNIGVVLNPLIMLVGMLLILGKGIRAGYTKSQRREAMDAQGLAGEVPI